MVATRTIGGFSGSSVVVVLLVAPVITVPFTLYVVVVICTTCMAAVELSEVLLKVVFLPDIRTVSARDLLFIRKSSALALRFLFVEILNSRLPGFRYSSS